MLDAPSDTSPIVVARDIVQRFGRQEVLHGVDLEVSAGQILGLLGPSGAGKTTFVNIVAGVAAPSAGDVHIFGEPMPDLRIMERMGYMAQSDALYMDLTADENLAFFGAMYGLSGKSLAEAGRKALEMAHLPHERRKLVRDYSGGMRRRLSLATAILHEPELLILDEPTIGLDPLHRVDIWAGFRRMAERGMTLLVTTHVMDEAERCDRLAMIRDGIFIAQGSPEQLKSRANAATLEDAFLHFAREEQYSRAHDVRVAAETPGGEDDA